LLAAANALNRASQIRDWMLVLLFRRFRLQSEQANLQFSFRKWSLDPCRIAKFSQLHLQCEVCFQFITIHGVPQ